VRQTDEFGGAKRVKAGEAAVPTYAHKVLLDQAPQGARHIVRRDIEDLREPPQVDSGACGAGKCHDAQCRELGGALPVTKSGVDLLAQRSLEALSSA
jgi:hypothetical protein